MVRRSLLTGASVALATLIGASLFVSHLTPSLAQDTTAPTAEIGLSKNMEGPVVVQGGKGYKSQLLGKTVQMGSLSLALYFTTATAGHCDELPRVFDGKMSCHWDVTLRADDKAFGTHRGSFRWEDTLGNVIEGDMHGTVGCGTHRRPGVHAGTTTSEDCEDCRVPYHVEGLMIGHVVSGPMLHEYGSAVINATYAGTLRGDGLTSLKSAVMSLDGVTIVPARTK